MGDVNFLWVLRLSLRDLDHLLFGTAIGSIPFPSQADLKPLQRGKPVIGNLLFA
jgi:hypothetical protein